MWKYARANSINPLISPYYKDRSKYKTSSNDSYTPRSEVYTAKPEFEIFTDQVFDARDTYIIHWEPDMKQAFLKAPYLLLIWYLLLSSWYKQAYRAYCSQSLSIPMIWSPNEKPEALMLWVINSRLLDYILQLVTSNENTYIPKSLHVSVRRYKLTESVCNCVTVQQFLIHGNTHLLCIAHCMLVYGRHLHMYL